MIEFKELSLVFPGKTCFEDFSTQIPSHARVAIIGNNGSGKSSFLKMVKGSLDATEGSISFPSGWRVAYVPQVVEELKGHSGGERLMHKVMEAIASQPDLLLLDEPTNHLDLKNRKKLARALQVFSGALFVVSHDPLLLRSQVDNFFHFESGKIELFRGSYDDYMHERQLRRAKLMREIERLKKEKKEIHGSLMKEQERASKSRDRGKKSVENKKWPTVVSKAKANQATRTTGKKREAIAYKRADLTEQLSQTRLHELIIPKFSISGEKVGKQNLISIIGGEVGYGENVVLRDINFALYGTDKIALMGDNGSGKTTLIQAILSSKEVFLKGEWHLPKLAQIGYLDQHYENLDTALTVYQSLEASAPHLSKNELRHFLSDFLFKKNEEVEKKITHLSGGEKARLSLALIAVHTPSLLILDEMTNNLDLETREHVIEVLSNYPGAMIVISHDEDFLNRINVTHRFFVEKQTIVPL